MHALVVTITVGLPFDRYVLYLMNEEEWKEHELELVSLISLRVSESFHVKAAKVNVMFNALAFIALMDEELFDVFYFYTILVMRQSCVIRQRIYLENLLQWRINLMG